MDAESRSFAISVLMVVKWRMLGGRIEADPSLCEMCSCTHFTSHVGTTETSAAPMCGLVTPLAEPALSASEYSSRVGDSKLCDADSKCRARLREAGHFSVNASIIGIMMVR